MKGWIVLMRDEVARLANYREARECLVPSAIGTLFSSYEAARHAVRRSQRIDRAYGLLNVTYQIRRVQP
jgi:hypothetical protein